MADKAGLWEHMTARYGLQPIRWQKLTAWPFVDAWFGMSYDMVQSTTKIRLARLIHQKCPEGLAGVA
jgi:hypothetical protein